MWSLLSTSLLASLVASAITTTGAAPVWSSRNSKRQLSRRQAGFQFLDYPDFQISNGASGTAEAEANAIFVDPFAGVDLATIDEDTLVAIKTMRELAEDAETELFNPQIEAAAGEEADALQRGKIKNKVLKLTAQKQALLIEIAQREAAGEDSSASTTKLAAEQTKLNNNIATDEGDAGLVSQAATGNVPVRSGRPNPTGASVGDNASGGETVVEPVVEEEESQQEESEEDNTSAGGSAGAFAVTTNYADFQISDGVAGNAASEANAIFTDPFVGVDLATVDDATLNGMSVMRELAEDAETELFNPQIEAASGADADALQAGKIKNKVLKLTAFSTVLKIKIAKGEAAGKDTSADEAKLVKELAKLNNNIATDEGNAGAASKSATGTVSPRARKARALGLENLKIWKARRL